MAPVLPNFNRLRDYPTDGCLRHTQKVFRRWKTGPLISSRYLIRGLVRSWSKRNGFPSTPICVAE